tara:strand:- start:1579 stop:1761 length:183 start_codon:yes stop_codon:yes gene_type:complete
VVDERLNCALFDHTFFRFTTIFRASFVHRQKNNPAKTNLMPDLYRQLSCSAQLAQLLLNL